MGLRWWWRTKVAVVVILVTVGLTFLAWSDLQEYKRTSDWVATTGTIEHLERETTTYTSWRNSGESFDVTHT
ncbi:MAG: hypothetical protein FWH11_02070 [Micrococcales bacterium]|nr:hypothetical protein [Micrococcales bacterium]